MSTCANVNSRECPVSIVNCPKCQFEQPQDQFCANCGIDMERYAQAHGSKSTKNLKPVLWAAGAVLTVLMGVFILSSLFKSSHFFGSEDLSLQEERIESLGRFNIGDQRRTAPAESQALRAAEPGSAPEPATTAQNTAAEPTVEKPLKLSFALVPADVVARWIQLSSDFSASENISSGVLGPVAFQNSSRDVETLMSYSSEDLVDGLPFLVTLEELPSIEALGFSLEGDWDEGVLSLEAVQIVPEEQAATPGAAPTWNEKESVQRWTFDLKNGSTVFITGLLPRPITARRGGPWNLPGLFDLWDLEDFVLGQKELVLIIAPGR